MAIEHSAASTIKALLESIEYDMYFGGCPQHELGLRKLLLKLGIKSAKWEDKLGMNSIQAAINQAVNNHGKPSTLFMDPKSLEQFKKLSKK